MLISIKILKRSFLINKTELPIVNRNDIVNGMSIKLQSELKEALLERFLRYVKITTMSDPHVETLPSTPGQWDLLHLLKRELGELGIADVELDQWGHLVARVPGNLRDGEVPTIGLMAHVDTSPDMSGVDVKPQVHRDYDGNVISLKEGYILDPVSYPELLQCKGGTVITSDGTTLLGADDKAGVSEIMTALSWLLAHDEITRGDLEIVLLPMRKPAEALIGLIPPALKPPAAIPWTEGSGVSSRGSVLMRLSQGFLVSAR